MKNLKSFVLPIGLIFNIGFAQTSFAEAPKTKGRTHNLILFSYEEKSDQMPEPKAEPVKDCKYRYSEKRHSISGKIALQGGGGTISASTAAGTARIAGVGTVSTTAAGASSTLAAIDIKNYRNLGQIVRLITEAELGEGLFLREVAGKIAVDYRDVASIISKANSNGDLCRSADQLLTFDEIIQYIIGVSSAQK